LDARFDDGGGQLCFSNALSARHTAKNLARRLCIDFEAMR